MPALTTLIVGDGDLSYAAYLACGKQMPTLTCSVFEADEDALLAVYPTAADHLESLRSNPNVEVRFGVDATKLPLHLQNDEAYSRIIFNFPQTLPSERKHRKVQFQRELLEMFFNSCSNTSVLKIGGMVQVALLAGQGGMEIEGKYKRPREGDSWQLVENAARAGFIVVNAPFFSECHNPVGFRGTEER